MLKLCRKWRPWRQLLAFLTIWVFIGSVSWAEERPEWLDVQPKAVKVDSAARKAWLENVFGHPEFWVLKSRRDFFDLLRSQNVGDDLIREISQHYSRFLPMETMGAVESLYDLSGKRLDGVIMNVEAFKERLPSWSLKAIYTYLYEADLGPISLAFNTIGEARWAIKDWEMPKEVESLALHSVIRGRDRFIVPVTPSLWKHMPKQQKAEYVDQLTEPQSPARAALSVKIRITPETDISEIAETFARQGEEEELRRSLEEKRRQHPRGKPTLLLKELLSPFARKTLDTYHAMGGPNCFNCGVSYNDGEEFEQRYTDVEELQERLEEEYSLVESSEARTGDLLVYKDKAGEIQHVSVFIYEGIVLTKNGINMFTPYAFQWRRLNEVLYFPGGDFELEVYRHESQEREKPAASSCGFVMRKSS